MRFARNRFALMLLIPLCAAVPAAAAPAADAPNTEQTATDARIAALQGALGITAAQMPAWQSFSQAMRDNAAATDALFRDRAARTGSMNALDNMRSYAGVARTYADNTQKLADAFGTLYGALDPKQQQTADTLFRQQAKKPAGK